MIEDNATKMPPPAVSVSVITFNHSKYIRDCLNGILMQKTNFSFEILVHDDASTDGTAEIVKEYENAYPGIVFAKYQEENQYSKGVKIGPVYQYSRVRGVYYAICEGDDYWTDPNKLQRQYDVLEENPNVDLCFHPSTIKYYNGKKEDGQLGYHGESKKTFSAGAVIVGEANFCPTNSLMIRYSSLSAYSSLGRKLYGSYFRQIIASLRGGALYIPEKMSVYRKGTDGSWTLRSKSNADFMFAHHSKFIDDVKTIREELGSNNYPEFDIVINKRYNKILSLQDVSINKRKDYFKREREFLPLRIRLKWIFFFRNELMFTIYRKIVGKG
jgi:glycosyltransferase involved in cell wall biosynthesis